MGKRNTVYGGPIYSTDQEVLHLKTRVMLRKAAFLIIPLLVLVAMAFTPDKGQKWTAVIELEGTTKPIILASDAIYGGYNPEGKKFFFFGKNHMFTSKTDPSKAKIFNDFCITNASGKFEFELNDVANPTIPGISSGNISFKRKHPIQGSLLIDKDLKESVQVKGDFKKLGLVLTPEASKVMTGKFTLTIIAEK
jgi:hypothetical protein